jgi:hypothetical protein
MAAKHRAPRAFAETTPAIHREIAWAVSSCDPLWAVPMAPQADTGASPRKHESTRDAGTITRAVTMKARGMQGRSPAP